jgi:hypothetical protein
MPGTGKGFLVQVVSKITIIGENDFSPGQRSHIMLNVIGQQSKPGHAENKKPNSTSGKI